MDRISELRSELRYSEAQLTELTETHAQTESVMSRLAWSLEETHAQLQSAHKAAKSKDRALSLAQAELDTERERTQAAEQEREEQRAQASTQHHHLRKQLASARREMEVLADRSSSNGHSSDISSTNKPPSGGSTRTAASSPSSNTTALTVSPEDVAELRSELDTSLAAQARLDTFLTSAQAQITLLRQGNMELQEENERLSQHMEEDLRRVPSAEKSKEESVPPSKLAPADRADLGSEPTDRSGALMASSDESPDYDEYELQVGQVSLAEETHWGMDERMSLLEEEKKKLEAQLAQLRSTNNDLTLCMAKMVDQINFQGDYASLTPSNATNRETQERSKSGISSARNSDVTPSNTSDTYPAGKPRQSGHARREGSLDWRALIPTGLFSSTSIIPPSDSAPSSASASGGQPAQPRRITRHEEVEDENDRLERERVRASLARLGLAPASAPHPYEQDSSGSARGPAPSDSSASTSATAGSGAGIGTFLARYLPRSTGVASSGSTPSSPSKLFSPIQPQRPTGALHSGSSPGQVLPSSTQEASQVPQSSDRLTAPPSRVSSRPRLNTPPSESAVAKNKST